MKIYIKSQNTQFSSDLKLKYDRNLCGVTFYRSNITCDALPGFCSKVKDILPTDDGSFHTWLTIMKKVVYFQIKSFMPSLTHTTIKNMNIYILTGVSTHITPSISVSINITPIILQWTSFLTVLLGGQLAFSPVVVHAVVGDGGELPAAVVLIVDIVCHVLQVLHVSPEGGDSQTLRNSHWIRSLRGA